jgi:hypothetical protein
MDQFHLLFRGVLKWKHAGSRIDQALDGIVVTKVHIHFAQNTQFLGWL